MPLGREIGPQDVKAISNGRLPACARRAARTCATAVINPCLPDMVNGNWAAPPNLDRLRCRNIGGIRQFVEIRCPTGEHIREVGKSPASKTLMLRIVCHAVSISTSSDRRAEVQPSRIEQMQAGGCLAEVPPTQPTGSVSVERREFLSGDGGPVAA